MRCIHPLRGLKIRAFSNLGKTVESKKICLVLEHLSKGKHLGDIMPRQSKHHHRVDANLAQEIEKSKRSVKVPRPANPVVVLRQALQTHLEKDRILDCDQFFNPLARHRITKDCSAEAPLGSSTVNREKVRMKKGVPPVNDICPLTLCCRQNPWKSSRRAIACFSPIGSLWLLS